MTRADAKYVNAQLKKLFPQKRLSSYDGWSVVDPAISDTGAFAAGNHLIITDLDAGTGTEWYQGDTNWDIEAKTHSPATDPLAEFPNDEPPVVTLNSDDHGKQFKLAAATMLDDVFTGFEVNPDGSLLGWFSDQYRLARVTFDAFASAGLDHVHLAPGIIDVVVAHKSWTIEFGETSARIVLDKDGNRMAIRTRYVPVSPPYSRVYSDGYDIDACVRLNLTGTALKSALKELGVSGAKRSNDVVVLTQDGRLFNAGTESSVTLSEDVHTDERVHFTMPVSAQLVVAIARNIGARDSIEFAWGHNGQLSAQQQRRPISYRVNNDHEGLLMPRRSDFVIPERAQARA